MDARAQIDDLDDQLTGAINAREEADTAFAAKAQQVVNGVLADPTEGPHSALAGTPTPNYGACVLDYLQFRSHAPLIQKL